MIIKYFEFEKSIEDLDNKIEILENNNNDSDLDLINRHKEEKKNLFIKIYNSLFICVLHIVFYIAKNNPKKNLY